VVTLTKLINAQNSVSPGGGRNPIPERMSKGLHSRVPIYHLDRSS